MSRKKLTESSFTYLNRSSRRGSAASRALIESWLAYISASEHSELCSRFRSGKENDFTSALQEIMLHELLRCQRCKIEFHPSVLDANKQPDFKVQQSQGPDFILEARTSMQIESGPDGGARAVRIREYLRSLDLQGYLLGIDELVEGSNDFSQKTLRNYIEVGIKAAVAGYVKDSISIPLFTTPTGWRIKLTAFAKSKYGPRSTTVMQETWGRTWTGRSYPLRDALEKKSQPLRSASTALRSRPELLRRGALEARFSGHALRLTAGICSAGDRSGYWFLGNGDYTKTYPSQRSSVHTKPVSANAPDRPGIRLPLSREELSNAQKTVMLTDRFWRDHFHADRKILGHAIKLAGRAYTVIGVLPPSFVFPLGRKADVLTTLPVSPTASHHDRFMAAWTVIGRLKPGVTLAEARANVQTLFAASKADATRMFCGSEPIVKSLQWRWVQYARLLLFVMAAGAGCFLLIACANVANLLLARFSIRSHELAVRAAIGAARARLVRQLLTEVALLTALECALGMAIIAIALRGFLHFAGDAIPRLHAVHVDGRVFAIALLVSVLTAVLFGVLPALRAGRVDVHAVLQQAGRAGLAGGRSLLRRCLVAMEIALSVVLVCGAALLLEALWHLENDHLGFPPEHVLTISLPLRGTKFGKGDRRALADEFLAYLRRTPGTAAAAISQCTPLTPGFAMWTFTRSDRPLPKPWHHGDDIAVCGAGPSYLKTAGIPLIRGRFFGSADFQHPGTLAVINQAAARAYFPDEDPLGKQIMGGHGSLWKTVIGIVGDTKNYTLNRPSVPQMFDNNLRLGDSRSVLFLVRSVANENALSDAIRGYLHSLDPRLFAKLQTLDQVIAQRTTGPRFDSVLIAAFASLAFLMAVIGIYGVLSFGIAQRTQEIGIRIALGAEPSRILALISREGALLTSIGIGAGLGGALVLTRYLGSLLYAVKPYDPATYAAVVIGLCVAAAIATYFPARRASMIDPVEALRRE